MKQHLHDACERFLGKPDALYEFKFEEPAHAFELAIRNPVPDYEEYDTAILSLGLSTDIEFILEIEKEISQDEAAEIAAVYVTLLRLLESEAEIVPGTTYPIAVPGTGMDAVIITDGILGYPEWLDEENQLSRMIWIRPLFAQEAVDLEKFTPDLRFELIETAGIEYRNPAREPAPIAQQAFMTIWGRISTWYTEHGVKSEDLLAHGLKSEKKSNAADVLEEKLGLTLPADFKVSFNMPHAGVRLGTFVLRDVDEIIEDWNSMNEHKSQGSFDAGVRKMKSYGDRTETEWWRKEWIPIGYNDSNGDRLLLSLAPSPDGVVRLIEFQIHEGPLATRFTSFFEYLRDYADDLERGKYNVADWGGLERD